MPGSSGAGVATTFSGPKGNVYLGILLPSFVTSRDAKSNLPIAWNNGMHANDNVCMTTSNHGGLEEQRINQLP